MRTLRLLAAAVATVVLAACASGGAATSPGGSGGATAKVSDASAIANAIDVANSPYVGSKKSKKYYPSACHTVKLIKAADQVGFGSQKDAEAAGYVKDVYSTDCQY